MLKDQADRLTSTEDMNMSYLDQIEELTHKLSQAESKVKNFESSRLEEGAKVTSLVFCCLCHIKTRTYLSLLFSVVTGDKVVFFLYPVHFWGFFSSWTECYFNSTLIYVFLFICIQNLHLYTMKIFSSFQLNASTHDSSLV